jgi:hypothetical protein
VGRIFFYKLAHDTGAAPCVHRGLLSLAICKPRIRCGAEVNDLIFGFGANSLRPRNRNRLIYVARITQKLAVGEYYKGKKYISRDDCIYRYDARQFWRRKNAKFHFNENDLTHDLGASPKYPRASVLLSLDFRYFGIAGTAEYKSKFPKIMQAVENLGIGERVNHDPELRTQLLDMKDWVWRTTHGKVLGSPTEAPARSNCHRSRSSCRIV